MGARRLSRSVVVSAVVLAAAFGFGGCTPTEPVTTAAWRTESVRAGGHAAAFSGILKQDDGCIYAYSDLDDEVYVPVFPGGQPTWVSENSFRAESRLFTFGEQVEFAGAGVPSNPDADYHVPDQCRPLQRWIVVW